MANQDIVLAAQSISKRYARKGSGASDGFWALQNISFQLRRGEILGIIGQNGAGKSTLLKILAEIIPPSTGQIEYTGSILSILDIGTGFHPDLSGYENIFLNASLLGMKKKETRLRAVEIIEFSGIKDFIHQPVKTYSSGMYLRLALSIALFTNNEIILLDEVISVGDAEFRLKAIQKIRDQANKGRACIMVSHDLNTIAQLCDKCLLLEKGSVLFSGAAGQAVQEYYESIHRRVSTGRTRPEHEVCEVLEVKFDKENYYTDEPVTLSVKYRVKVKGDIRIIVKIGLLQNPVMTDSVAYRHNFEPILYEPGVYETQCTIPQNILNRGNYLADIIVGSEFDVFIDFPLAARFTIQVEEWEANKNWNTTGVTYPLRPHLHWETKRLPDYDQ